MKGCGWYSRPAQLDSDARPPGRLRHRERLMPPLKAKATASARIETDKLDSEILASFRGRTSSPAPTNQHMLPGF